MQQTVGTIYFHPNQVDVVPANLIARLNREMYTAFRGAVAAFSEEDQIWRVPSKKLVTQLTDTIDQLEDPTTANKVIDEIVENRLFLYTPETSSLVELHLRLRGYDVAYIGKN